MSSVVRDVTIAEPRQPSCIGACCPSNRGQTHYQTPLAGALSVSVSLLAAAARPRRETWTALLDRSWVGPVQQQLHPLLPFSSCSLVWLAAALPLGQLLAPLGFAQVAVAR